VSEPSDWREHGFAGGIIVGALWAARELLPKFLRGGGDDLPQRKITPADVREEVLRLGGKMDALSLRFDSFQAEENRIHAKIEQELRDALQRNHKGDTR
jgi:hypothetical protein